MLVQQNSERWTNETTNYEHQPNSQPSQPLIKIQNIYLYGDYNNNHNNNNYNTTYEIMLDWRFSFITQWTT